MFNRCTFAETMDTDQLGLPSPKSLSARSLPVPYVLVDDEASKLFETVQHTRAAQTHLNAEKMKKMVLACCVLNNYLIRTNKTKYAAVNLIITTRGKILSRINGDWRREVKTEGGSSETMFSLQRPREPAASAKDVQNKFKAYFVEEGKMAPQNRMV